jgi:hypothetical protein
VDGKTLRGARRDGRQVHLLAVMDHATRAKNAGALGPAEDEAGHRPAPSWRGELPRVSAQQALKVWSSWMRWTAPPATVKVK